MSSKVDYKELAEEKIDFVKNTQGVCPDCEEASLDEGPRGGMSRNYHCPNDDCGSEFNFGFAPSFDWNHLLRGERI